MGRCCSCLILRVLFDDFWWFVDFVTENHKSSIVVSLAVGSLASAYYFWQEGVKLEEQLEDLLVTLRKAEDENHSLRKRALTLRRQKNRLEAEVCKVDTSRRRAEETVKRLKHKDSLSRAEMSALSVEIQGLKGKVAGARRDRDSCKVQLETLLRNPYSLSHRDEIIRPVCGESLASYDQQSALNTFQKYWD